MRAWNTTTACTEYTIIIIQQELARRLYPNRKTAQHHYEVLVASLSFRALSFLLPLQLSGLADHKRVAEKGFGILFGERAVHEPQELGETG